MHCENKYYDKKTLAVKYQCNGMEEDTNSNKEAAYTKKDSERARITSTTTIAKTTRTQTPEFDA